MAEEACWVVAVVVVEKDGHQAVVKEAIYPDMSILVEAYVKPFQILADPYLMYEIRVG